MDTPLPIVGLIPAAGLATRLQPLPFSKELYPIGFGSEGEIIGHPKVAAAYLVEQMAAGGAEQLYFILRSGKWDIPAYFGDGSSYSLNIAYMLMGLPFGAPYSADQAYTFVKDKLVLFGFPDILLAEPGAFAHLVAKQAETEADVVLGVFEVDNPDKWDVVELHSDGSIANVYPKPHQSKSIYAWAFACWSPSFTAFMHAYLQQIQESISTSGKELSIGAVLQAAIKNGLRVQGVQFSKDSCLDIGTPEDLRKAIIKYT
ncbi:nucleotidyltransferase family protein [Pontibacter cellulosilyticus]|uniref:glucose-1-phosphate thymidylyltransferase n=1 Tax=Pontibacter cellulosilyticus TaxID=1720253 RepID=A0A923NBB6_9BACT|nr:sugar phosphate nucleotidyltransferase [Pontibacter cellulosilyticus]MBC5994277.1 dTDP-glucose pyrophosphorylase [Pontibacter cellulosilyticus]